MDNAKIRLTEMGAMSDKLLRLFLTSHFKD